MSRTNTTRRLNLEKLEAREVKAGDVSVSVSNGNLTVTGDSFGNDIEIHQSTVNWYRVKGLNGTTINGRADKLVRVTGNMNIDLKNGDDKFFMGGTLFADDVSGNLNITMGNGDDKVGLGFVNVKGTTTINTNEDDDQVNLFGGIKGGKFVNLNVNTGAGNDEVNAAFILGKNFTVDTAADEDTVDLFVTIFSDTTNLKTGTEDDTVIVEQSTATTALKVDTDAGDDAITLQKLLITNNFDIKSGENNDTVTLDALQAKGTLNINTAGGDDTVNTLNASILDKLLDIRTAAGNDTVNLENVTAKGAIKIDTLTGNDIVTLTNILATAQDITINTGDNTDIVTLTEVIADDLFANLGTGGDDFFLEDSTFDVANIDGNDGGDDFTDLGGNDVNTLNLTSI